jgi:imidazole glycerol-phosphate synthase subunit HisH
MIVILKYNAGNIKSVQNALTRSGYQSVITDNETEIRKADKVIIPGVGEASSAMHYLKQRGLDNLICSLNQPVLGICLGLQLMCRFSEEASTQCMGIFDTIVRKFPPADKVPHMGWNNFTSIEGAMFNGVTKDDDVYFVHSYYAEISSSTIATCDYIISFSAAMQYKNFYATQFHPEKSAFVGATILNNFLKL